MENKYYHNVFLNLMSMVLELTCFKAFNLNAGSQITLICMQQLVLKSM